MFCRRLFDLAEPVGSRLEFLLGAFNPRKLPSAPPSSKLPALVSTNLTSSPLRFVLPSSFSATRGGRSRFSPLGLIVPYRVPPELENGFRLGRRPNPARKLQKYLLTINSGKDPVLRRFIFHAVPPTSLKVANVPAVMDKLGPFEAVIQLINPIFPADFTRFDLVANAATCQLDNVLTPAAYFPADATYAFPSVRCFANATSWGQKTISFGFDTTSMFPVQTPLSFVAPSTGVASTPIPSPDVGVPLFGLGNLLSLSPPRNQPTVLPTDAKLCVRFNNDAAAANANLASIALDSGSLSPAFSPAQTNYGVTGNSANSPTFGFTVTPAAAGAIVSVDNLTPASVTGAAQYYQTKLVSGSNYFVIRITAPNGFTQNVYYLTVTSTVPSGITSLVPLTVSKFNAAPPGAQLYPPFSPDVFDYKLDVQVLVDSLIFNAAGGTPQPSLFVASAPPDPTSNPPPLYANISAPFVSVQPDDSTPSLNLCLPYPKNNGSGTALLRGGRGVPLAALSALPAGFAFKQSATGGLTTGATLGVNCIGTTVLYVWVPQADNTATLYIISVQRGYSGSTEPPALFRMEVVGGGSPFQPAFSPSNPPSTAYSINASPGQQLQIRTVPSIMALPIATIRTVPPAVTLALGHNKFDIVLTATDNVTTTSYHIDAIVRSNDPSLTALGYYLPDGSVVPIPQSSFTPNGQQQVRGVCL